MQPHRNGLPGDAFVRAPPRNVPVRSYEIGSVAATVPARRSPATSSASARLTISSFTLTHTPLTHHLLRHQKVGAPHGVVRCGEREWSTERGGVRRFVTVTGGWPGAKRRKRARKRPFRDGKRDDAG